MKVLELTLQAFGPFRDRQTVRFSDLGNAPLFLINGPTGSGKTTLLDAICFALYGSTTGNEREGSDMRCQQSPDSIISEVVLRFELGGKCYQIARQPTQLRPRVRGTGTTEHKTRASLYRLGKDGSTDNGELLVEQKVQDANRRIIELTGLNANQFRQVMVLPQGQFRQLLLADSSEREAIFQSLFRTDIYKRIEERLKSAAADIRRNFEQGQSRLQAIIEAGEVSDEQALIQALANIDSDVKAQVQAADAAFKAWQAADNQLVKARTLDRAAKALSEANTQLDALNAQASEIAAEQKALALARCASALEPAFARRHQAEDHLLEASAACERASECQQTADSALTVAQQVLVQATQAQQQSAALRQEIAELEAMKPAVTRLLQISDHQRSQQQQLTEKMAAQQAVSKDLAAAKNRLSSLKCKSSALEEALTASEGVERAQQAAQLQLDKACQRDQLRQAQHEFADRLAQQLVAEQAAEIELEQQQQQLKILRRNWHLGQAYRLAQELQQGQACPVCGSQSHPAPADNFEVDKPLPDEAELNIQEQRCQQADSQLVKCRQQIAVIQAQCEQLQQQLNQCQQSLASNTAEAGQTLDFFKQQLQILAMQWQQRIGQLEQYRQLGLHLHEQEMQVQQIQEQLSVQNAQCTAAELVLRETSSRRAELETRLPEPYRIEGALDKQRQHIGHQLDTLLNQLEEAHQQLRQAEHADSEARAAVKAAQARLKYANDELAKALGQLEHALADSPFDSAEACKQAQLSVQQLAQREQALDTYQQILAATHTRIEVLQAQLSGEELADVAACEVCEQAARKQRDDAATHRESLLRRQQNLYTTQRKLEYERKASRALEARYKVVGTLAEVANGQSGSRISLQRYVLGILLDDVLSQASDRLFSMSGGRYHLLRKLDPNKGRRAAGLDLEVYDNYSGSARPVATLSGGESFQAALALALGLSDVVQSQAGGIALDTLFVDEGFGSLDAEALELAIQTLLELQHSGRTVGIISHVAELKSRLDTRIDLTHNRRGSQISLIAPSVIRHHV